MNRRPLLAAILAAALPASVASAALVGVDFDSNIANGPANWKVITTSGNYNNLLDENGAATTIDLSISVPQTTIAESITPGTIPTHTTPLAGLNAMQVHPFFSFAFLGLTPSAQYKIWIFGLYDLDSGPADFDAHIDGEVLTDINFNITSAGTLYINGAAGSSANTLDSYAITLTSTNTGFFNFFFDTNGANGEIGIAGVAIEAVPEPATLALLAIAAPTVLLRRRRA
jgi:hypothetical protein